ncbi:MAG: HU family DNA-binding protein [Clostridia bacterium]|jgi:DNA-binding protein HU-beta|nr:HU family DNA-binding protein [Clostridia bacterium]MBQ4243704.1 HU family DNA-binding protein [Clostridia bacterium]
MNKTELIAAVAAKADVSKKDAEKVINATLDAIGDALANKKDGKVTLIGFGTFETRARKARTGLNPQTGEKIKVPATKVASFKAGAGLKAKVAKK